MPYNIINPGSVEDAWNNPQSVFNQAQDNDRQTQAVQQGLLNQTLQNYTGNIDLGNRPVVQNPDGSISTVRSMSFNEDGKEVLIPTVSQNGTIMSPQQAIDEYHRTGQHLGLFNNIADANAMARQIHNQQEQMYGNTVPGAATQMAAQGNTVARRKPTAAEYEAGVINYLVNNRGYSYEDAQQLMAPRIQAYKVQEAAENRNMADNLIASMQNMKIDSPEYRQAAFQLYRLDPQMGTFMLKEGIGPREQYLRGQKLEDQQTAMQQKMDYARFNSQLQLGNALQRMRAQDAYTQQRMQSQIDFLVKNGMNPQQAVLQVVGGGGRRGSSVGTGGVTKDDYKQAMEGKKALAEKIAENRAVNPDYQLSPEEQDMWNMYDAVEKRQLAEFAQRNGIGQNKQKQPAKINPNDYNSVGPFIQWAVEQNKGFTPELARAIRAKLGFNPDDNSQNNFVNQIFKSHYNFSG